MLMMMDLNRPEVCSLPLRNLDQSPPECHNLVAELS
jgi:hypothetical protein